MKKLVYLILLVFSILMIGGCAKAPALEIEKAKVEMDSLIIFGSDVILPADYNTLKAKYDSVNVLLAKEDSKFVLFRNYDDETVMLNGVIADYATLKANTVAAVNNKLTEVKALAVEVQGLLDVAPRGKEGKMVVEAYQTDLNAINLKVAAVDMNSIDYKTTFNTLVDFQNQLNVIKSDLETAIKK
jgi:hypothetical protein